MASNIDLGLVTAYGYAKAGGYTGTEAEFQELLGTLKAHEEQAGNYATQAASSASDANTYKEEVKSLLDDISPEPYFVADTEEQAEQIAATADDNTIVVAMEE